MAYACGVIGTMDAVMGPTQTHPHSTEGAARIRRLVDDFKGSGGRLAKHFSNAHWISFNNPSVL